MHPLSSVFFGPSGLPCLFISNGTPTIGYIIKQTGTKKFRVSSGSSGAITTRLAQNTDELAMNDTCTILVTPFGSTTPEHIRYLTSKKCVTVEGHMYAWHIGDATPTIASITVPSGTSYVANAVIISDGTI